MFIWTRKRLNGLTGLGVSLLQLLCAVHSIICNVHCIRSHACRNNVSCNFIKELRFLRPWNRAPSIAFVPIPTYTDHLWQGLGICSITEAPSGALRDMSILVHGTMDPGQQNQAFNSYRQPWKWSHDKSRSSYEGYKYPRHQGNPYNHLKGVYPDVYANGSSVQYQRDHYHLRNYGDPSLSSYKGSYHVSRNHGGYSDCPRVSEYSGPSAKGFGAWHNIGSDPFNAATRKGWFKQPNNDHLTPYSNETAYNSFQSTTTSSTSADSVMRRGGIYGSEHLKKGRSKWSTNAYDSDVSSSREYFASFRPYDDIEWLYDKTTDNEWPGYEKLKQGETYDGIIRHWLTPLNAVFLTVDKMTECCLVTEGIPLEYTLPSVRSNFKVDHVLNAKLKWPQEFDEKGRPKVVLSFDRQHSPFLYAEGDYVWGTPLFFKKNFALMKLDHGDHLGLLFLAELGMQLINSDTYKFSDFLQKGDRIKLQVARMPSFPRVTTYLVRVPWDSSKRLDWAEKFPEIRDSIAPCVYGSYLPVTELIRDSTTEGLQKPNSYDSKESFHSVNFPVTENIYSILPTLSHPQTISQFTKRVGGKMKDVLRLLFLQTKTPIDPEANLTVNLAKSIYNFVNGRAEFQDIDEYTLEEELGLLKGKSVIKNLERPPIVVLMGHINHGKTSLFDMLTETSNIDDEPGNITQTLRTHMLMGDTPMTLIDTPGHELFDAMRGCGAKLADIALVVVDAVEGLKKQTRESIKLCKNMSIPFIIVATKCDLPNAQHGAEELAIQLGEEGVVIEGLGGETQFLQVSSKQDKENYKNVILNSIMLQAAVSDDKVLTETPDTIGRGFVLESGKGCRSSPYCLAILKQGKMAKDSYFVSGKSTVKIRTIKTPSGKRITSAKPSQPVIIDGFEDGIIPTPGKEFVVYSDEDHATCITEYNTQKDLQNLAEKALRQGVYIGMNELKEHQDEDTSLKRVPVILKSSTQGSVEALKRAISAITLHGMMTTGIFDIVDESTGPIYKSDVMNAKDANALILGLGSTARSDAKGEAKKHNVTIVTSEVIYDLVEKSTHALKELLGDKVLTNLYGTARILKVFDATKNTKAAGCLVTKGVIPKLSAVRVLRQGKPVYSGTISSLRHTTDAVEQAVETQSCGIIFKGWNDVQVDDIVEAYSL